MPGSNQKEKKEPGGKSCLGFFKESWKGHCKSVVVVNYHHNGMLRAGQRDRTGVTDKLADNGKITVLTIFESQKQEEAGGRKEAYE